MPVKKSSKKKQKKRLVNRDNWLCNQRKRAGAAGEAYTTRQKKLKKNLLIETIDDAIREKEQEQLESHIQLGKKNLGI